MNLRGMNSGAAGNRRDYGDSGFYAETDSRTKLQSGPRAEKTLLRCFRILRVYGLENETSIWTADGIIREGSQGFVAWAISATRRRELDRVDRYLAIGLDDGIARDFLQA